MSDEYLCANCAGVLGYIMPLENRADICDTTHAFTLAENFIPTATHADGRRVFSFVAEPRAYKNSAEIKAIAARQVEADAAYSQRSEEERRQIDELRASGVLKSWAQVADEEKARAENLRQPSPGAHISISYQVEVAEAAKGFYVRCPCGRAELVK